MSNYKQVTVNKKQIGLHRHLMEKKLGRKLASFELVHHIDGNKHNNNLDNLKIVTNAEHMKIHKTGVKTRFKDKFIIDREKLRCLYEEGGYTMQAIADILKINFGVIWRRINKYNIRKEMKCTECSRKIEMYIRARLCNRCYIRNYQRVYRAKRKRV